MATQPKKRKPKPKTNIGGAGLVWPKKKKDPRKKSN